MRDAKRKYKYSWLWSLLLVCASAVADKPIVASTNDFILSFLPENHAQIDVALQAANLNIQHTSLPIRRSLAMLERGEIAIDTFRTPVAVAAIPDLIKLTPVVGRSEFWLIAASPELCEIDAEYYPDYPVVGIRGIRLYGSLYPGFKHHTATKNFTTAWKMLQAEHAYFSVWPQAVIEQFKQGGETIYVCGNKPYAVFDFYSYVHKSYAWAVPELERSYLEVFGGEPE